MKEDLLKEFRSEYIKRLKEKEKNDRDLKILLDRKSILENSTIVRDYIKLTKQIEEATNSINTVDEVFTDTLYDFNQKGLTDETNNIYLYDGSYFNENGYNRKVEKNSSLAEFDRYINIESFENIDIPVEDRNVFEEKNSVLSIESDIPSKYLVYEIRDQFINDALFDGQEAACRKVLSRNKKNF